MERYSTYDPFAWFYNREWGSDYHNAAQPALETLVFSRLRPGAAVLDLCCGTGDLSRQLEARGYRITGIDGSEEMLRYARENAPSAQFIAADARNFRLPACYDAALSTFDSLNHIVAIRELEAVFRNVYAALAPGGFFVFDLNMEESFRTLWHGSYSTVEEKCVCITRGSYDPRKKLGRADVTTFRLNEQWERSDLTVFEKCYSPEEVQAALGAAGFREIECYDACDLKMRGDIAIGRSFFFGRKLTEAAR